MRARGVLATLAVAVVAAAVGWWAGTASRHAGAGPGTGEAAVAGPCPGGGEPLYWKAPMDPSYVRDAPGKSPMGMDLVPVCPKGTGAGTDAAVRIDPNVVQNIGMRTEPVGRRDLVRRIRTVGRVGYDERLVTHVHTKIQGWVERLRTDHVGQMVERGRPLLEIYSPELLSTQEELLLAARYRDSTGRSDIPDVAEGGEALFRATRRRLELWDIPERDIEQLLATGEVRKTLTLYAPHGGVVTELGVREGMEVGPDQNLYTIADLSRVWVNADIYEYELPWVSVGQPARVELSYLPGRVFEGEVTYVYPFLDPRTRTARARIELANPDLVLKPEMYGNVSIEGERREAVLAVPEAAVIRSGTRSLGIVAVGDGRFEPRQLTLGLDSGDGWLEVRDGLVEGERIVTSGQFLIDSESRLQDAVRQLLGEEAASEAEPGESAGPAGHEGHDMPEPAPPHAGHAAPMQEHP